MILKKVTHFVLSPITQEREVNPDFIQIVCAHVFLIELHTQKEYIYKNIKKTNTFKIIFYLLPNNFRKVQKRLMIICYLRFKNLTDFFSTSL